MNVQKYHNEMKSEERLFNCTESTPNRYKCVICNFRCDLKIDLFDHSVRIHNFAEIKHDLTNILKKFNCENCNFQTYSFLVFYKHHCKPWELKIVEKAAHSNIEPFNCVNVVGLYKCTNCHFCTNLKILLKWHSNQVHKNQTLSDSSTALDLQKNFTCLKCSLQTSSILVLYKHVCTSMKSRRREKQIMWLQCALCNFKTKYKASLPRHLKLMHPPGKCHKCKHCGHIFSQIIDLESHLLRMHSAENEKPFHCEHCEFKTKSEDALARHLTLKHGIAAGFTCEHCKSTFIKKLHLKKHLEQEHSVKNIKWYTCDFCEFTSKYTANMKTHLLRKHANNHLAKNTVKLFNCVYCDHTFLLHAELKKHLTEQHSIGKTGKRFLCEHCDYKTKYSSQLKTHMLRKHTDHQNINYWFKCEHCEDKFILKRHLDDHLLKVHSNKDEKWWHCDQCEYKAPFNWRLKYHILNKHTDAHKIDWFQCEQCPFKSKLKTPLKLHVLRRHTNLQLVKCDLCPYVGKQAIYLKKHKQAKHKEEA